MKKYFPYIIIAALIAGAVWYFKNKKETDTKESETDPEIQKYLKIAQENESCSVCIRKRNKKTTYLFYADEKKYTISKEIYDALVAAGVKKFGKVKR